MKKGIFHHHSESGFTMTEILIAAGLSALVAGGAAYVFTNVTKQREQAHKSLENMSDEKLAERVIIKDLMRSSPSFNILKSKFFDYIPDGRCVLDCTRTHRMEQKGEFWVLIADSEDMGTPIAFDPPEAYQITTAEDGTVTAVTFDLAKLKTYMNKKNEKTDEKIFGKMWEKQNFLMFYTPVPLRVLPTDPVPRFFGFVAQVDSGASGINLVNPTVHTAEGVEDSAFSMNHPISGAVVNSVDQMLRSVPPVGGTGTLLFVRPVKLVRYKIDEKGTFSRAEIKQMSGAQAPSEFVIARKVKHVEFSRDTIASTVIKYSLKWDKPVSASLPAAAASPSAGP